MKKLLKARFLPPNYEQTLYSQYQNCCQSTRSVADYIEEFHRLERTNLSENEQHQIARFIRGLRFDIKEKVKLQSFQLLSEAVSFAETVKEMNAIRTKNLSQKAPWEATSTKRPNYSNKATNQPSTSVQGKEKEVETQDLADEKKKEAVSRGKTQNNYTRPSLGKCFPCGQSSHLSNTFPP